MGQCRLTCVSVWYPGLRNDGAKKKKMEVKEGEVECSPKKKIKLKDDKKPTIEDGTKSTIVETIEETEEISQKKDKVKKKKKKKVTMAEAKTTSSDNGNADAVKICV